MRARLAALPVARRVPLVMCLGAFAILAAIGLGVGHRLHHTDILVPGTAAARAAALNQRAFGPTQDLVVLLEGPQSALRRQGPSIASRLRSAGPVSVLDPWNGGGHQLTPRPGQAILLIAAHASFETVTNRTVVALRRALGASVRAPVRGYLSGYADIANAINTSTLDAVTRAEIIAAPALLIVLLLVLGSPVAALVPLSMGGIIVGAAQGVLRLINGLTPLDTLSVSVASMLGLALGVDYSLLLVTRFRSELAAGRAVPDAVAVTIARAGRTVRFAGTVLALVLGVTLLLYPGSVLKSAIVGGLTAVALSVCGALAMTPGLLQLLGPLVNRWQLFTPGAQSERWSTLALRALRRPVLAGGAVLVLLLALGAPVATSKTGPPDPQTLPAGARARTDFLHILSAVGGGRVAPFVITVLADQGTLADRRLATLAAFENRVRQQPQTASVLGPATIAARTASLAAAARRLPAASAAVARTRDGSRRLVSGLGRATDGLAQLLSGLARAARASESVAAGSGTARTGAQALAGGLRDASTGAQTLQAGLGGALIGASRIADGAQAAAGGAQALATGARDGAGKLGAALPRARLLASGLAAGANALQRLQSPATIAQQNAEQALRALEAMLPSSKLDPQYGVAYRAAAASVAALSGRDPSTGASVAAGYPGLAAALHIAAGQAHAGAAGARQLLRGLTQFASGLDRLQRGSIGLASGLGRLREGAGALRAGLVRLQAGGGSLVGGLGRLSGGAAGLAAGLSRLSAGSSALQGGLLAGGRSATPLESGLVSLSGGAHALQRGLTRLSSGVRQTVRLAPILRSGYAVLGALDQAPAPLRNAAGWAINLDRGGTAVQFLVVQHGIPTHRGNPYRTTLERLADSLGRQVHGTALVGGPATTLADFDQAVIGPMVRNVALLMLITFVALALVMRAPGLAAIAVVLNALTVGAALGVLSLAFGPGAPLGGPGYVDDLMLASAFTVIFALSIDYEIFLLDRMREGYAATGSVDGAIAYGLRNTAGVITGAAIIMAAVFAAFAASSSVLLRELGVGLTVGVLLDATLVRLVLLPAAIRLAGPRAWRWQRRSAGVLA